MNKHYIFDCCVNNRCKNRDDKWMNGCITYMNEEFHECNNKKLSKVVLLKCLNKKCDEFDGKHYYTNECENNSYGYNIELIYEK